MSFDHIANALKLDISPAALKFVLIAIASYGGADDCCYPSIARLVSDTSLNRKTVLKYIKQLQESGVLIDTGERRGATNSIVVYKLVLPQNEAVPNLRGSSTKFTRKQSQIRDTEYIKEQTKEQITITPPDKTKEPKAKSLAKCTVEDLQPWLEKKKKEGIVFDFDVKLELEKCQNYFLGKSRTIGTAYNWFLSNHERKKDQKQHYHKPVKEQPHTGGTKEDYDRIMQEIGLEP